MENIESESYLFSTNSYLSYAIRIISRSPDARADGVITKLSNHEGSTVRAEVISALMRRGQWMVLSDLKNQFRTMSPLERRLMIMASYVLRDEGKHWRQSASKRISTRFENYIKDWIGARATGIAGLQ